MLLFAACRAKTKQEEIFHGLLSGTLPYDLEVFEVEGKGRGVRVRENRGVRHGLYLAYEISNCP